MRKSVFRASALGIYLLAIPLMPGCSLCLAASQCTDDSECPVGTSCSDNACVVDSVDQGEGEGEGEGEGGEGEGEGEGDQDAGPDDAGTDAGPEDAGQPDAGPEDAGPEDAGFVDGGIDDAGQPLSCDPATGFPPEVPPDDLLTFEDDDPIDGQMDTLVFRPEGFPLFCPQDGSCDNGACQKFRDAPAHVVTDNGFLDDTLDDGDLITPEADGNFRIRFNQAPFDQPGFFFIGTLVSSVSDDGVNPPTADGYRDGIGVVEYDLTVWCSERTPESPSLCERRAGPPVFYRIESGWDQVQDLLTPEGNGDAP